MTAFAIIIYILFGMYVFYFLSGFINGFTGRWTIKARFWAEIIIGVILLFSVIGLSGVLKSTSSSTTVATQVSTTTENANTPETSTVLGNTIAPTYNGSDLVNLRLECAGQAQTGFARFVQNQNQIDSQAGINDGDRYTLSQYHFNQKSSHWFRDIKKRNGEQLALHNLYLTSSYLRTCHPDRHSNHQVSTLAFEFLNSLHFKNLFLCYSF